MHLKAFSGITFVSALAGLAGLVALLGLAMLLSSQIFAQGNSAPEFSEGATATRSVNEYTGTDVEVDRPWYENIGAPITATDDDSDIITYTIKNSRTSPFYIDWFTGQLQVGTPLDYEDQTSHTVTVVATDPSGEKDEIVVTVNVNNLDETGKVVLKWKPASGTGVEFEAEATDPDGIAGTPTWQWASSSTQNGTFSPISGATSATYVHDGSYKYLRATGTYTDAGFNAERTPSQYQDTGQPNNIDSSYTLEFDASSSSGYRCTGGTPDFCLSVSRSQTPADDIFYPAYVRYTKSGAGDKHPQPSDIRYSLGGTDAQYFEVDAVTKELFITAPHTMEAKSNFSITITASDPSGRSDTTTVKVLPIGGTYNPVVMGPREITYPENGTWPLADFDGWIYDRELNEDVGWIIGVEPGGGDGDFFDIDENGVLYFTQPPDFEDPADDNGDNVYRFSLHVWDANPRGGKRPGEIYPNVTVTVLNAQEALEINGPTSVDYPENGTDPVHTYGVTGASGTVAWSIAGQDSGLFTINNGVLSFVNSPDYEAPFDSSDAAADRNDYLFNIYVTDGNSSGKIEPVRIMVTDVNEPPAFSDSEDGRRTISESAGSNEDIGDLFEAEDPDGDLLDYSLGGTDALSFSIDQYSGQLKTAAVLDFESKTSYSLTVSVTDGKNGDGEYDNSADDTINVTVSVTGANEAPTITGEDTIDYPETSTLDVEDYDATDPENDYVTWSLKEVDDYDDLSINSTTGVLTFDLPPDYEDPQNTDHEYLVTVVATDSNSNASELPVTITITQVDDPPVITYDGNTGAQTISFDENDTGAVATFIAIDQENNSIAWDKSGDDETLFSISNAGVLSFISPPDYEDAKDQGQNNHYEVTVEASDGTNDAVMNVTVRVDNVDEDPVVTGDTGPSVVEGNADAFGTYTAADPEDGTITWVDPTGADGSLFEITSGGKLSFKTAPDFETPESAAGTNVHQVTVNASDGTNTGSLAVTVTVVNSNEVIVREGTWTTARDYPENSDSTVATYAATDPEGETITWDLDGNDDDKLSISSAGVLTFNTVPDFEDKKDHNTDNVYEVTVIASDGTNKETQEVRITITNVNEAPVLTVVEEVTFAEGGTGTVVTFEVTDPDANTTITWSLSGTDAGDFNDITKPTNEPMKGELTFETVPDRESPADDDTSNDYDITVKATDEDGEFDEMDVTILVSDEDETPALSGPTAFEYAENSHYTAATYNAVDPEDDDITWTLLGDDKDLFNLSTVHDDASTANLFFRSAPDFEEDDPAKQDHDNNDVYELTIQATDGNANHVQTLDVAITVTDENETPVMDAITIDDYEENGTGDVADFSATDPENDTLEWTLSGDDDAYFEIDDATGVLTFVDPPDYEHEVNNVQKYTYDIKVQASDDEFTASMDVTVTVTDVDETPVISGETENDTVNPFFDHEENDASPVHRFSALDPEGTAITWELDGADKDMLDISGGVLEFPSPPDFEDPQDSGGNNVYNITVKVTDNTNNSATLPVTVTVTNINEDPEFDAETATVEVDENTPANRNIESPFKATDEDTVDRLTYTLGGTDKDSFQMTSSHSSGAQLRTKAALDFETKEQYTITILVRDGVDDLGDPNVTADDTIDITIEVTNVDEDGTVALSSEQPEEEQSITATLDDVDGGVTGLTWQWATASSRTSSSWTNATGTTTSSGMTSTYTAVTADVNKYLRATASYTDAQGASKTAHGVSANKVQAKPPDPMPPVFSLDSTSRSVAENAVPETNVGTPVTATDPERKALTYSLEGTDASSFTIVQSSGQIQTKEGIELDFETKPTYTVTVRATDPGTLSDTIVVTINLVDVPEAPGKVVINTVMQSPGNEQGGLMVKWNPPDNTGPDITGYNLKYAPLGTNGWEEEETSNTQKELGDLWPDTEYEVMVNAENSEGDGSWSDTGAGTTKAKVESEWIVLTASFGAASYSVNEGSRVTIRVNLSPAADRRGQAIPITVTAGSAENGDYTVTGLTDGGVPFVPGDTSINFTIRANQDNDKNDETVTLSFGDTLPTKILAGSITSVTVRINDDDKTPPPSRPTPPSTPSTPTEPTPTPKIPSTPTPPGGGGGGGGFFFGGFGGGSGSGGSGSGGSSGGGASSDANRPPYFDEGVATERTVTEHTDRALYLGDPVTATDPDGDVLTYALGGIDADSFALDSQTGQLITSATLDFELKPSYDVVMTVVDGRGAADAIEITIKVIDLTEVPIYSPETQPAALVKPGEATTIETPDRAASVSFPAKSRDGYYWARLDSASTRCGFDPDDEELQASLIVEFFDRWGTREHQVVLVNPATVELRLDASSFGGTEAVLAAHARGAYSVYTRNTRNYTTLQWSQVAFTLAVDDEGRVIITLADLTSLDCFAVTTLPALFTPEQPAATPTPTPAPTPRAQVQPTPTPAPKAEPQPTPTVESEGIKIPLLIPQAVAEAGEVANPTPEAPDSAEQTEPTPAPVAMEAQLGPELEDGGLAVWPILLMALGAALSAFSLWLFLSAKRRRRF